MSVIVTCFQQADLLLVTLPALLEQLTPHDEVIIADDGSPDGSADRLAQAFRPEPRVRVLHGAATGSVSRTRNRGFASATGDWIAFLDGDDDFMSNWRAAMNSAVRSFPDVDVFFGDYLPWRPDAPDKTLRTGFAAKQFEAQLRPLIIDSKDAWHELDGERLQDLMLRIWVPFLTCAMLYRREWLQQADVLHDPRLLASEDTDFQLRAMRGARVAFTEQPLSRYRLVNSGLSTRSDSRFVLSRHLQRYSMLQLPAAHRGSAAEDGIWRRIATSECLLAGALLREGHVRSAQRHAVRSLVTAPRWSTLRLVLRTFMARLRRAGTAPDND